MERCAEPALRQRLPRHGGRLRQDARTARAAALAAARPAQVGGLPPAGRRQRKRRQVPSRKYPRFCFRAPAAQQSHARHLWRGVQVSARGTHHDVSG